MSSQVTFWNTEQIKTGKQLATLAEKVPAIKNHGKKLQLMNDHTLARNGIVKTIDFMMKNPTLGAKCWAVIETHVVDCAAQSSRLSSSTAIVPHDSKTSVDEPELSACTTWGKIPPVIRATILCGCPGAPQADIANKILEKDPLAMDDIAEMMLQIRKSDHIPADARNFNVLKQMALARAAQVGNRFAGWVDASVDAEGTINWSAQPLFKHSWQDGVLIGCKHMPSGALAQVPTHLRIDSTWSFDNPTSDDQARWSKGGSIEYIKMWFISTAGPNAYRLDKKGKGFGLLAASAQALIKTKHSELASLLEVSVMQLTDKRKRQREDALAAARSARQSSAKKGPRALTLTPSIGHEDDRPNVTLHAAG